jgi:hypothetical protein
MRIIPGDIEPHTHEIVGIGEVAHFDAADTIEITDAEWDGIYNAFRSQGYDPATNTWGAPLVQSFSQYLKELIQLKEEQK